MAASRRLFGARDDRAQDRPARPRVTVVVVLAVTRCYRYEHLVRKPWIPKSFHDKHSNLRPISITQQSLCLCERWFQSHDARTIFIPNMPCYRYDGYRDKESPSWPPSLRGILQPHADLTRQNETDREKYDYSEFLVNDAFLLAYADLNEESRAIVSKAILAAPMTQIKIQTRIHLREPFDSSYILIRLILSSLQGHPTVQTIIMATDANLYGAIQNSLDKLPALRTVVLARPLRLDTQQHMSPTKQQEVTEEIDGWSHLRNFDGIAMATHVSDLGIGLATHLCQTGRHQLETWRPSTRRIAPRHCVRPSPRYIPGLQLWFDN